MRRLPLKHESKDHASDANMFLITLFQKRYTMFEYNNFHHLSTEAKWFFWEGHNSYQISLPLMLFSILRLFVIFWNPTCTCLISFMDTGKLLKWIEKYRYERLLVIRIIMSILWVTAKKTVMEPQSLESRKK